MHISTANISQMVADSANIAIANKYKVAYLPSIDISKFNLAPF